MSIADWDPAACEGRAGLPQSGKESDTIESDQSVEEPVIGNGEAIAGLSETTVRINGTTGRLNHLNHPLHRLAAVRRQQGVSLRNMARRLGADVSSVLHQEQEASDLSLSVLYEWQRALDVPVADLLVDSDAPLSAPVMARARMVKVMKTAVALMEKAQTNPQRRLITMLMEQLIEIMPELREVSAWHSVGQRRTLDEFGRAVERTLPDELLRRTR
jgi:transcriptional regulator with XRE-family HTH domain